MIGPRLLPPIAPPSPRVRLLLAAAAAAGAVVLARSPEPGRAAAGRAAIVAIALSAAGAVATRIAGRRATSRGDGLVVAARQPLGRDAAVAVLDVRGRSFLVGWSPGGVRLLAELGPPPGGTA